MKKWRIMAAVTSAALLCGVLPANIGELKIPSLTAHADDGYVELDADGVLHLYGAFQKDDLTPFRGSLSSHSSYYEDPDSGFDIPNFWDVYVSPETPVYSVIAEPGTVFPEDSSNLFELFGDAESFDLSKADTSHTTNMKEMFDRCISAEWMDLSGFDTSGVTDMSGMFDTYYDDEDIYSPKENLEHAWSRLTSLDLSSFDTSKTENMDRMFRGCELLETIYVSDLWTTDAVTGSSQMFFYCDSLCGEAGTEYDISNATGAYAQIDGGEDAPGYFTSGSINRVKGVSLALNAGFLQGDLALNYYTELNFNAAAVRLSGPNGELVFDDFSQHWAQVSPYAQAYLFSYPLNATQAGCEIGIEVLDENGEVLPIFNSAGKMAADRKIEYSADQYIANVTAYNSEPELEKLINSIDNYCKAAHNYFCGTNYPITGIADVTAETLQAYAVLPEGISLELTLNSRLCMKIYGLNTSEQSVSSYEGYTYRYTNYPNLKDEAGRLVCMNDHYEIDEIPAYDIINTYFYENVAGMDVSVSPMHYAYLALTKTTDTKLHDVVKALYVYGYAAKDYSGFNDEEI